MPAATAYLPPYMYKKDPSTGEILTVAGDEYYNNNVPYEGVLIHYLNELQDLADGDFKISYTFGSKASKLVHPASAFTAAVQDIEDGLVDMAVSPFWVTGQRLRMAAFTVPLYYSRLMLVIPDPGKNDSLGYQTIKVFEPFEGATWALVFSVITVAALLSVWFSNRSQHAEERYGRGLRRPRQPERRAKRVYARLALDSFLEKGLFFCSAGIEQERGANLPSKLLMFGFGGFILIVVSSYVANLAAFLTKSEYPEFIGTMEEVVANGKKKVCALPALQTELKVAWPSVNFVFSQSGKSYYGLLDDYDNNLCDFLVVGQTDAGSSIELLNEFCDRGLIFTDSLVIENQVALPIRPELAAGLSYWMYQGEKYWGISVQASQEKYDSFYKREADCTLTMVSDQGNRDGDYAHIAPKNLFFPCMFFLTCAILAAILQVYHQWNHTSLIGTLSQLGLGNISRNRGLGNSCNDVRPDCETADAVASDPDVDEFHEDSLGHINERTESLSGSKGSASSRLKCASEEFRKDVAKGVVDEDSELLNGDATNATSRLGQLVETGAFDEILACVQEIKKQKRGL